MRRPILLVLSALALAACSPEFDPASKLEKLRVVAIQAEPPEIDPAGVATLTSLVLRADFAAQPARVTSVLHVACVPAPGQVAPSPCVHMASLADPTELLAAAAPAACAPAQPPRPGTVPFPVLAGVEACVGGVCGAAALSGVSPPSVSVPADYYDPRFVATVMPPDSPEWILGTQAVVLAFAVDATPGELAAAAGGACTGADLLTNLAALWKTREHVLSTKRVAIRGPESPNPVNRNPAVDGILLGGVALDPAGTTTVVTGEHQLGPQVPAGAAGRPETYVKLDAAGAVIENATEEWVYSWFSTAGEFEHLHTRGADETDPWTIYPGSQGRARVALVVRDLRGGTAWTVREVGLAP